MFNQKKKYFKKKLKGVQCMIWDLEFKSWDWLIRVETIRKTKSVTPA